MPLVLDPNEYRSSDAVSFSKLKVFERSPLLYYRYFIARDAPAKEETDSMRLGSAAHCMILEGPMAFTERYAIQPAVYESKDGLKPWNNNAKVCELWCASQATMGRIVMTAKEAETLVELREAVRSNPDAVRLLAVGTPELAIRRHNPCLGFNTQGRLDWLADHEGVIVDLKTIDNIDRLDMEIERRGYYRQMAFYRHLAAEEYCREDFRCAIIGVEKECPNRCAVRYLSEDYLTYGDCDNAKSLIKLAAAMASNDWGGNPETREIGPSPELVFARMEAEANA